jgi:hypothetical protein
MQDTSAGKPTRAQAPRARRPAPAPPPRRSTRTPAPRPRPRPPRRASSRRCARTAPRGWASASQRAACCASQALSSCSPCPLTLCLAAAPVCSRSVQPQPPPARALSGCSPCLLTLCRELIAGCAPAAHRNAPAFRGLARPTAQSHGCVSGCALRCRRLAFRGPPLAALPHSAGCYDRGGREAVAQRRSSAPQAARRATRSAPRAQVPLLHRRGGQADVAADHDAGDAGRGRERGLAHRGVPPRGPDGEAGHRGLLGAVRRLPPQRHARPAREGAGAVRPRAWRPAREPSRERRAAAPAASPPGQRGCAAESPFWLWRALSGAGVLPSGLPHRAAAAWQVPAGSLTSPRGSFLQVPYPHRICCLAAGSCRTCCPLTCTSAAPTAPTCAPERRPGCRPGRLRPQRARCCPTGRMPGARAGRPDETRARAGGGDAALAAAARQAHLQLRVEGGPHLLPADVLPHPLVRVCGRCHGTLGFRGSVPDSC